MIKSVVLFIHTVKYLKLIQIFYRVKLYIFNKKVVSTHKKILTSNTNVNWLIQTHKKSSMLDNKTFIFLNKIGNYINDGWDNKSREKLWNYNLHYFDDLNSRNSINRKEFHKKLINDWINDNGLSAYEACLAFCLSHREIDYFLFGVDNITQMKQLIDHLPALTMLAEDLNFPRSLSSSDLKLINPSMWAIKQAK